MQLKSKSAALAAAALCGALLTTSVSAATEAEQQFSALQGVEAQTLSANEMDAIHGAVLTDAEAAYLARLNTAATALIAKVANPELNAKLTAAWAATLSKLTAFLTRT